MSDKIKVGDRVAWKSSGGRSTGKVVKKQTALMKIRGHKVAASPDNPDFIVESEKSSARTAHKPDALRKL